MSHLLRTMLLCGGFLLTPVVYSLVAAQAQSAITPLPDPVVGAAPTAPSDAQETYDGVAIRQLMKIVELSKSIGGGISQLFSVTQTQTQALIGTKTFPINNDVGDQTGRQAGTGLLEMANAALGGAAIGPQVLIDALTVFRTDYGLDQAFALQNDTSASNVMAAHAAAQGAIVASTGEDSYKRANASMARLDGYITALQASPDLKTSMDINTRVTIELVQQLNETLRTQAAIASMAGTYFMIMGGEAGEGDNLSGLANFNR